MHAKEVMLKKAIIPALFAAGLVGCSPYPDEGKINTQVITDKMSLVDARGDIYGISVGLMDKVQQYSNDYSALWQYPRDAWDAHTSGSPIPELALTYEGGEAIPSMANYETVVLDGIKSEYDEKKAEVDKEIAEYEAAIAKLSKQQAEAKAQGAEFDALVAGEKAKFEAAKKAFETAEKRVDESFKQGLASINETLKKVGLEPFSSRLNPLSRYQYIDFAEKNIKTPSACPSQGRQYTTIDARAELDTCFYFQLNNTYRAHEDTIAKVTKPAMVEFVSARKTLGEDGGWNRKGTGAHKKLSDAKSAYQKAVSNARDKFGDNRKRERLLASIDRKLAELNEQVSIRKEEGYVASQSVGGIGYYLAPDDVDKLRNAYLDAVVADIAKGIEKATPITFLEESEGAVFEDLSGDYEGILLLGEFVGEYSGRRIVNSALDYVDLRPESVQDADIITVELDRRAFRDGEDVSFDDPKDIAKEMVWILKREVEKG